MPAEAETYFYDPDCGIVFTDVLDDVLSDRPALVALLEEDFGLASQDAARVCKLMVVHLKREAKTSPALVAAEQQQQAKLAAAAAAPAGGGVELFDFCQVIPNTLHEHV